MTQAEGVALARKIVNTIMTDLNNRQGILDGVDDEVREEMSIELLEKIIDDLPFTDNGARE